jgi:A/G-specific adenine glycosylase
VALHEALLDWYVANRRDLPWRRTRDPYAIWVSEVMLQQTQVATVVPYFEQWMARFPTLCALAQASEDEVLQMWQGLGYYRRAKMLRNGARRLVETGKTSVDYRAISGIGPYTAGAICSIAFGEPAPLVDGNVERVYARLSADDAVGSALRKNAWQWAAEMVSAERPGDWNQALMELGATICRPRNPDCPSCPVAKFCEARKQDLESVLPRAAPKPATIKLIHHTWIPVCGGRIGVRRIPDGEWWAGMWEFPRASDQAELSSMFESAPTPIGTVRHTVTRHRIELRVSLVRLSKELPSLAWHTPNELAQLAMPAPQRRACQMAGPYAI